MVRPEDQVPQMLELPAAAADPLAAEERIAFARRTLANPIVQAVLACAEGDVLVLDAERRLVAANPELLGRLDPPGLEPHLGRAVGEVLGCTHAGEVPGGCGSGPACDACGVVRAIEQGHAGDGPVVVDWAFNVRREGRLAAVAYRAKISTVRLGCHELTVVALQDVTARRRAEWLEAAFLEDLDHAVQSLIGWSELVADGTSDPRKAARRISDLCQRLREELGQQRMLRAAERGGLEVDLERVELAELLEELRDLFLVRGHECAARLLIERVPHGIDLRTDRELLLRALQGLVRWAFERVAPGAAVRIGAEPRGLRCQLTIQVAGVVPAALAARVFHPDQAGTGSRSSLGTYGAKLVLEDYLGGTLGFRSSVETGTSFTLDLPRG